MEVKFDVEVLSDDINIIDKIRYRIHHNFNKGRQFGETNHLPSGQEYRLHYIIQIIIISGKGRCFHQCRY